MPEFNIGQIFDGTYPPEAADFCNIRQDCVITEITKGGGKRMFQIQKIPEPTVEEKSAKIREIRDAYLSRFVDPVVTNPLRWDELSDDEKDKVKAYRVYLLDYPESSGYWYESRPMTFDAWKAQTE